MQQRDHELTPTVLLSSGNCVRQARVYLYYYYILLSVIIHTTALFSAQLGFVFFSFLFFHSHDIIVLIPMRYRFHSNDSDRFSQGGAALLHCPPERFSL